MKWIPAYVGLGSNLQDPPRQVRKALAALAKLPSTRLVCQSALFGSRPMGPVAQADFCNAAAGLLTQLDAEALLVYGDERRSTDVLRLPHPGIAERHFVLRPLSDFAPDLVVPGVGRVADLAAKVSSADLWVIDGAEA